MFAVDPLTLILYSTALAGGLLVGAVSPSLAYSRSIMLGITLMHSVLAGALAGVYLSTVTGLPIPPEIMAVLFAAVASILTAEAVNRGVPEDSSIAVSVTLSVTLTLILTFYVAFATPLGLAKAMSYVFGTSSLATVEDLFRMGLALIIVVPLTHLFWSEYKYISFDPEGAESLGLSVRFYRYLYYILAAVTVTTLAMSLGVLLTHIIVTVPGLYALRKRYTYPFRLTYILGILMMIGGYGIARYFVLPPSVGVGIVSSIIIGYILVSSYER